MNRALYDLQTEAHFAGKGIRPAASPVALVTGGSTGIGAACVRQFLAAGWKIAVAALPGVEIDRLAGDGVLTIAGDLTCARTREAAVQQTLGRYGRIDVLVNSIGVGLYALPTESPVEYLRRILDVNVIAPMAVTQMVIPPMRKQGGGTIVNISSVAASVSLPWAAAYCASKSALSSLHDSLRRELRGSPVHLIEVCPGIVDTNFREHVLGGAPPSAVRAIRRVVSAEQLAVRILRAIQRRSKTVYLPRIGAIFALAGILAPSVMDWYIGRLLAPERRKAPGAAPIGVKESP
jgi:short-subunit dehydrogenase